MWRRFYLFLLEGFAWLKNDFEKTVLLRTRVQSMTFGRQLVGFRSGFAVFFLTTLQNRSENAQKLVLNRKKIEFRLVSSRSLKCTPEKYYKNLYFETSKK